MPQLKVYVCNHIMIVSFIVLIISLLFALRGFTEAQIWFSLLRPDGLKEIRAKVTAIEQNANIVSISYDYEITSTNGEITSYTNTMKISDVSLDTDNMVQEFQETIPVEYLPDAPAYSIISKTRWPRIYYQQLEDSIVAKWFNGLLIPAIFSVISLFCLILLLGKGKKLSVQSTNASA